MNFKLSSMAYVAAELVIALCLVGLALYAMPGFAVASSSNAIVASVNVPQACYIVANVPTITFQSSGAGVGPGTTSAFNAIMYSDTAGNIASTITVYGGNWLYANAAFGFAVGSTAWNSVATLPGTALTLSPGASTGVSLPGPGTANIFWVVSIPAAQPSNTYSQTITATTSC